MILLCLIRFRCLTRGTMLHNLDLLNRYIAVNWRRRYHDDVLMQRDGTISISRVSPADMRQSVRRITDQTGDKLTIFHRASRRDRLSHDRSGRAPASRTIVGCEYAIICAARGVERQCATIYLPSTTTFRVAYRATSPTPAESCSKHPHENKKLSCRRETVRQLRGSVLAKCNWETIFCGHYRSIFNHCDIFGLES